VANSPRFNDAAAVAAVNAVGPLLNSGLISIYTGAQPAVNGALTGTLLASLAFPVTAFGAASASGGTVTATAGTIPAGTAVATGTAGYVALVSSGGTAVATGSVGVTGADLNMSSLSLLLGEIVSCTSFTLTLPES
jgi:hypothetical protein